MAAISSPASTAPARAVAPPATAPDAATAWARTRAVLATTGRTLALCAIVLLVPGEAGKIGPSLGRD